ncbi:MAG TPA: BON domain-containing protein [Gemmataceae bacterium]|nr:BON domain-containing protein [Gemmataceae bacterium]
MLCHKRYLLAAALGLWMTQPLLGKEPPRLDVKPSGDLTPRRELPANQLVANTIVEHLRQSGQLHRYTIDVAFANGTAVLSGAVADQLQREEALRIVQGVPGVERVRDYLALAAGDSVTQAQANVPAPQEAGPAPRKEPATGNGNGQPVEPRPIFVAPPPSPTDLNPPKMPTYAWPTYAPYNNYSRVAYPTQYPYQCWPYIGPVYPFPKIPLGWRSVSLEWQDGYWFYSAHSNSHDWWRLRYW